jgi:transposase
MEKSIRTAVDRTIGLDLGDKYSELCALDAQGELVEQGRLRTTPDAFRRRFHGVPPCRIALEVGTHSPWVTRLLEEGGHQVVAANARKVRLISANDRKGDQLDAELLARVARMDPKLLCPIQHRTGDSQQDLGVLRSRDALVRARTQLINHTRGAVKSFGGRLVKCSSGSFHKQAPGQVPVPLRPALLGVIETIGRLTRLIRDYDKQIERMAQRYPETNLLRQVAGVGPITATSFVLTLEDPQRFPRSRTVGAYLGLRPRRHQSGQRDPELRITKGGDSSLRRLLVAAAHYILGPFGPDCDLRRWGLGLADRGDKNAKKRAVVAVARKLAVLLHRLWVTAEVYEPLRQARRRVQRTVSISQSASA